jgi:GNAT superfamily N-acetyltransferase
MSLYTISKADTLPSIKSPAGLQVKECTDTVLLAQMASITEEAVINRLANDHVAFVAYMNSEPAAFGWMARGKARIGELNHELILPIGNRYLWNFRTMSAYRGLGIYPALLQYIIQQEAEKANRFWIIHAPENNASLKGIQKAGFQYVGKLYVNQDGIATIENTTASNNYHELLEQMDISLSMEAPASCWNCSSPYLKKREAACCCAASANICIGNNLLAIAS